MVGRHDGTCHGDVKCVNDDRLKMLTIECVAVDFNHYTCICVITI